MCRRLLFTYSLLKLIHNLSLCRGTRARLENQLRSQNVNKLRLADNEHFWRWRLDETNYERRLLWNGLIKVVTRRKQQNQQKLTVRQILIQIRYRNCWQKKSWNVWTKKNSKSFVKITKSVKIWILNYFLYKNRQIVWRSALLPSENVNKRSQFFSHFVPSKLKWN